MFITHPVINMKCVVFSAFVIGLYFYSPHECVTNSKTNTLLVGYLIFFFSYLSMALYDEYHFRKHCNSGGEDLLLKSGSGPTSVLKPPPRSEQQLQKKETGPQMVVIWLSHVVFLAPLVIYLGIYGLEAYSANNNNKSLNAVLVFLGVMTTLYHGGRLLTYVQQDDVGGPYLIDVGAAKQIEWDAIVDVRSLGEYNNNGNHPQAIHVPGGGELQSVARRYNFQKGFKILVVCRSGSRAHKSAEILRNLGYNNAFALNGNWSELL